MTELASVQPILLAEDNPVDLDLTRRAFARCKLANPLMVARDGEEALAWIPRWEAGEPHPRVVLLDLKLPRVDGLEVLRRLKSNAASRAIPVVVLTIMAIRAAPGDENMSAYRRDGSLSPSLSQRERGRRSALRAIFTVTSSGDEGDVRAAYELGANSYIVKPVDFDTFLEVAAGIEHYWCALNRPPR